MKKILKKTLCLVMALTMIFACTQVQSVQAKTYTKTEMNKKVKECKKEIASLQKKLDKENKKLKEQKKGTKSIYYGDVWCTNPYIIKDGITGNLYWITNPEKMNTILSLGIGAVKPTGKYKTYNGYTCAVAKAVTLTANPTKYKEKISALKEKMEMYTDATKAHIVFDKSKENTYTTEGKTYTIKWDWNDYGVYKYNTVKFTSSDSKVLKIVDSKKCKVKALKAGTVTITAIASCSQKKTKLKVVVQPKKEFAVIKEMEFLGGGDSENLAEGNGLAIGLTPDTYDARFKEGELKIYSDNEDVLSIGNIFLPDTNDFCSFSLDLHSEGVANVCAETQEGVFISLPIKVYLDSDGNLCATSIID